MNRFFSNSAVNAITVHGENESDAYLYQNRGADFSAIGWQTAVERRLTA